MGQRGVLARQQLADSVSWWLVEQVVPLRVWINQEEQLGKETDAQPRAPAQGNKDDEVDKP